MNYFKDCTTLDQAKSLFRKLCFELHPDKRTDKAQAHKDFIELQAQFKSITDRLKFNTGFDTDKDFNAGRFYDMVQKFDGLVDIKISFVGSFIWLEDLKYGAMYQQKETIKGISLEGYNPARWANKKKSWYFSPVNYSKKGHKAQTLGQIKTKYGAKEFNTRQTKVLTA